MQNDIWKVLFAVTLLLAAGFGYKAFVAAPAESGNMMTDGMMDGNHMMTGDAHGGGAVAIAGRDIARRADDLPPPITRAENTTVKVDLRTEEYVAEVEPGVTFKYWTYNGQVPGPMIRVKEGDMVEIVLTHVAGADHQHAGIEVDGMEQVAATGLADAGHSHNTETVKAGTMTVEEQHAMEGHTTHSVDLHAVLGPGGGAGMTQAAHDVTEKFAFKAMRPGLYIYHCASPHIPTHIAHGMYGMILVEPKSGLHGVDREFYVMQGELYTDKKAGVPGLHEFSKDNMDDEHPSYVVFNGRKGALAGDRALKAKTGETVRLFFGVGTYLPSNFHLIGGILEKLYPEGDIVSAPHKNVQTTLVPAGGAMMTEFQMLVPGKFLLVDHALPRAIDKGAVGELLVEGAERPDIIREVQQ